MRNSNIFCIFQTYEHIFTYFLSKNVLRKNKRLREITCTYRFENANLGKSINATDKARNASDYPQGFFMGELFDYLNVFVCRIKKIKDVDVKENACMFRYLLCVLKPNPVVRIWAVEAHVKYIFKYWLYTKMLQETSRNRLETQIDAIYFYFCTGKEFFTKMSQKSHNYRKIQIEENYDFSYLYYNLNEFFVQVGCFHDRVIDNHNVLTTRNYCFMEV